MSESLSWLVAGALIAVFTNSEIEIFGAALLCTLPPIPSTAVDELTSLWSISESICSSIGKALNHMLLTGLFWPIRRTLSSA